MSRVLVLLLVTAVTPPVFGRELPFDRGMRLVLDEYLQVYGALCRAGQRQVVAPTKKKIAKASRRIKRLAARLALSKRDVPTQRRQRWLKQTIGSAADTLGRVQNLATIREAFATLSRALATWGVRANLARVNVVFFARTQSVWLQRGRELRSPYVGFGKGHHGLVVAGPDKGWTAEETLAPGDPASVDRREGRVTIDVEGLPSYLRSR